MQTFHVVEEFRPYHTEAPTKATAVPSMMWIHEKSLLYWLAQDYFKGRGVICDCGLFLGASTRCFGEGLRDNPNLTTILASRALPIRSYERGIVNPTMLKYFTRHEIGLQLNAGDSFAPILRHFIEPVADLVDLHVGDILEEPVVAEPIEILFLDVLKSPAIADFIVRSYFPKLIPGVSIVVQQDYFMPELPFIKVLQEHFRARFDYCGEAGSSAIFRLREAITQEQADHFVDNKPDGETQLRLSSIAMQRSIDPYRRLFMALSKARLMVGIHGADAAQKYLRQVAEDFPELYDNANLLRLQAAIADVHSFIERWLPKSARPPVALKDGSI